MIIDSHCHLYDDKLTSIRDEILDNISKNRQICVCSSDNPANSKKSLDLAIENKFVYATVGTHPHEAEFFREEDLKIYEQMCKNKKVVAVGEIGLDYYYDFSPREIQKEVLIKQIAFANKINLPCVFHIREAMEDFLKILKEYKNLLIKPALIHSFSGSIEVAKILLKYGFYLSFNGIVTFKNANKILDVVRFVPMDRILIETDCPYLTPVPFRGSVNRPEYVKFVAEKIAELKGLTTSQVIDITTNNAKKFFSIEE